MKDTVLQELVKAHQNLADQYRNAASAAMADHDPFVVYFLVKESMTQETKARTLKMRYGRS